MKDELIVYCQGLVVDGIQTVHYDSDTSRAVLKQDWMDKAVNTQLWDMLTQDFLDSQQNFKANTGTLKQLFSQTGGAHVFQRIIGCEWNNETGDVSGFRQDGYDGEDFISFDLKTETWIAAKPEAVPIKEAWDKDQAYIEQTKILLTQQCPEMLKLLVEIGNSTLRRTEPPPVSAVVIAVVVGLLVLLVAVVGLIIAWRRNWHRRVHQYFKVLVCDSSRLHSLMYFYSASSEVPNFPDFMIDGLVDDVQVIHYDSDSRRAEFRQDWMDRVTADDPQYLARYTEIYLAHELWFRANLGRFEKLLNLTEGVHTAQVIYGCEWDNETGHVESGFNKVSFDGGDFLTFDLKTETWIAAKPEAVPFKRVLDKDSALKSVIKDFFTEQCPYYVKKFVDSGKSFLLRTVKHSLKYFLTTSSGVQNLPQFVGVGMVDDVEIGSCSTLKTAEPQDWMVNLAKEDPQHLEWYHFDCISHQKFFRANLNNLKQRLNQTGGVHILQRISGCGWDDETGEVTGFSQFGYDGEDFISLDIETLTWIAAKPQALITKHQWDSDTARLEHNKHFFLQTCPDWIRSYVDYGRSFLQRKELPSVSLLQKTSSSPVRCLATGFYPDRAMIFWRRDGVEIHEDVEHGEILPNQDGTFQMSVDLDVSSVTAEDWGRWDCVFQLSGVKEDMVTRLDRAGIRTNEVNPSHTGIIIGAVIIIFVLAIAVVGYLVYRKKNGLHSLKFFFTGSTEVPNFPEFVAVGLVDDVQMFRYDSDSRKTVPKQDWMDRVTEDKADYWDWQTGKHLFQQQVFKANIGIAKQRFNHTGGVHIVQRMYGCGWDDETGEINGFDQFSFDGEDFISFDLKTETWIVSKPQAVLTKHKLDKNKAFTAQVKYFLTKEFPEWLKKYVNYGKDALRRTELPSVSLLQKTSSSPVRCLATGFYPKTASLVWRRDGVEIHEDVEHGEILPNQDGTFQMSVDLDVSSVRAEDWRKLECVFQLSGVKEDMVTRLDRDHIRSNWGKTRTRSEGVQVLVPSVGIIVGAVVVLCVVITVIGFLIYRKKNAKRPPSPVNNTKCVFEEQPLNQQQDLETQ
ncbi:uncharacterized protein V6R79_007924 [Siganus canaliculatus]